MESWGELRVVTFAYLEWQLLVIIPYLLSV